MAITLGVLCVANLQGQSNGHDLPGGLQSLAGVTLNRDSAATIRAKLGTTRERRIGVGHDVYVVWCYALSGASSRGILELMSDASDMGTPGHALNVIRLRSDAPSQDRVGCARLPPSAAPSTPAGLRLGLAAAKIAELFGRPTRVGADSLTYYFDAKEYLRLGSSEYERWDTPEFRESCFNAGPPYANVESTVVIVLRDDKVAEIRIERYDQSAC